MATAPTRGFLDIPPATYARFKATLPALGLIKKRNAKHQGPRDAGVPLDTIILHDTESTPKSESAVRYFADPQDGRPISIHYLIGRNYGEIVAMVPEHRRANHCAGGNNNDRSIGIELYKKKIDTGDFTDWQYTAVAQLVCDLRLRWSLPQSSVKSHDELSVPKVDPRNFNWLRFEAHVKSYLLRLRLIDPSINL